MTKIICFYDKLAGLKDFLVQKIITFRLIFARKIYLSMTTKSQHFRYEHITTPALILAHSKVKTQTFAGGGGGGV